jgi:cell division protein FtsQ
MPLEMTDPEDGDPSRLDWGRPGPERRGRADGERQSGPWWRPVSTAGRVFLALGALVVVGALGSGIYLLKTYLQRDARFRIDGTSNIQAAGLSEVSRAAMLPIFGEDIGRNVFFVPLAERRKELEAIPWVEHATVMRVLPDQIRVQVVERKPVAFVRLDQEIGLVDASGVLLTMPAATMEQHHYSFPVVTGIDPRDPLSSRAARMAVYERLMGELDANNQHLSEQISEINLTDPEDARVLMPEQGTDILAHLGEDHFLERFQRYKAHIAEWRQQYPKLAAVDLRYDQQVVLQMASGTGTADATIGDMGGAGANTDKPVPGEPMQTETGKQASPTTQAASKEPAKGHAAKEPARGRATSGRETAARNKRALSRRSALHQNRRKPSTPIHTIESD